MSVSIMHSDMTLQSSLRRYCWKGKGDFWGTTGKSEEVRKSVVLKEHAYRLPASTQLRAQLLQCVVVQHEEVEFSSL